jgi:tagaturonate reductase
MEVRPESLVERVVQFGEGNFLRGFVDWAIHEANKAGHFGGSVVVLQPIAHGLVPVLNEQQGLFSLVLRGQQEGERVVSETIVSSISRGLECESDWERVLECAQQPEIDIVVSNTTEAGITYVPEDSMELNPPISFPGKLCAFLYRRFVTFDGAPYRGMLVIPCELIDRNGDNLRMIVERLAVEWGLGADFVRWLNESNVFVNTLVDRIVTGYPGDEESAEFNRKWGYEDRLIVTAEPFYLWVIEGPREAAERFPVHKAGLDVLWVDDMTPYRTRKVRILNGAHTSTVATAYLAGIDFVKDAVEDKVIGAYLRAVIFEEIIPTLDMAENELTRFASQVLERFQNPFIRHRWLDISLNSISKFKARVLPSMLYHLERGIYPLSSPSPLQPRSASTGGPWPPTALSSGHAMGSRTRCVTTPLFSSTSILRGLIKGATRAPLRYLRSHVRTSGDSTSHSIRVWSIRSRTIWPRLTETVSRRS